VGFAYEIVGSGSLSPVEGAGWQQYKITIKNNGSQPAGGSYNAIKFAGNLAPDGNGICWIPSVPNFCTTVAITTAFAGGRITVTADSSGNLINQGTMENNNVSGTLATFAVKPKQVIEEFVYPPFAAYGYKD
jgi:hypothetical protein